MDVCVSLRAKLPYLPPTSRALIRTGEGRGSVFVPLISKWQFNCSRYSLAVLRTTGVWENAVENLRRGREWIYDYREGGRVAGGLLCYQEITIYIEICYVRSITKNDFFSFFFSFFFFFSTLKNSDTDRMCISCVRIYVRVRDVYVYTVVYKGLGLTMECCDPNNELILWNFPTNERTFTAISSVLSYPVLSCPVVSCRVLSYTSLSNV